jgi:aspartate aminotransferase-like enzyme
LFFYFYCFLFSLSFPDMSSQPIVTANKANNNQISTPSAPSPVVLTRLSLQTYDIGMVPGPTIVPDRYLTAYTTNYGSADLEDDFFDLYKKVQGQLQEALAAPSHSMVIMSGEGMLALWGALKSVVCKGDRVLAIANGIYGHGIGEMAKQIGAEVEFVEFDYTQAATDTEKIREAAQRFRPLLITAVHCETPTGVLNPVDGIGKIAREVDAFFYVDFVSSGLGATLRVEEWNIDLGLLGSQKVLSILPSLCVVSISQRVWSRIETVSYVGYDALLPWQTAVEKKYLPYTFNWHALSALSLSLEDLLKEGVQNVVKRHEAVAAYCRARLRDMGLGLYPSREEYCSPTVTAVYVPLKERGGDWDSWADFDEELRKKGLVVGGSYEALTGKVFRIGHMGSQANMAMVERAMDVLQQVLEAKKIKQ